MRLADFILDNLEPILQSWEDFARSIPSAARSLDAKGLRDHAEQMLRAIADDLRTSQSVTEQIDKSVGKADRRLDKTAAEIHAVLRHDAGFSIDEMVSEYRALRSSVLRKWLQAIKNGTAFEVEDMTRFNEAIDQALAESVASYSRTVTTTRNVFLGILGHDLRTPLGAIQLGAEVLLLDDNLGAKPTKLASRIFTSAKRANKIVTDLLDFTRSQSGAGIPLHRLEINLAAVCEGMVEEVRAYNPEHQIICKTRGNLTGRFDAARMEQVFSNLISNAVQHGSRTAPVKVDMHVDEDHAVFTVHNQGEPIARSALADIFNPLSRHSHYAAGEYGPQSGLGLGLYIASEIVSAHKGTIGVESSAKQGTTFTVRLPLAYESRRPADPVDETSP
ncbi:sensor histidine kinase [Pseudomonas songnenensis]|jgi:signal transduction histidine kinase|uniref:histidine kinase n=1 Tax=Pseudomonas songnenensis TaxID=1176259 RepID=A0A482U2V9_9PSED|nr:sensor histidine kinase [Pseudomonas songnenensis]MCQ4298836.1 sensor histidine kinase [Pseudomonas songnenensis]RMH99135.1 sensor histidine kinase [Pseudomonas songnenensis]RYJ60775.1 sensor histidine kinase [Pseudomonas songnenensis]